ncbi:MAG: FHA domain-containing protein [Polyangiaceae bacterium]
MNAIRLVIDYGDGRTEERTFSDGTYQIGREVGDIVLRDPNLSGQHALLTVALGSATIVDQGSTNGTFDSVGRRLNGPQQMRPGEPIRLGVSSLTLLPRIQAGGTQVMPQFAPMSAAAPGNYTPAAAYAPAPPRAGYGLRGTLIKAPDATPGLVLVNGQQRPFVLENIWRIPAAPVAGMTVEVAFDVQGNISALSPVDTAQLALEHGQQVAELARKGYGVALERIGTAPLIATAVLWVGWFILPALQYGPVMSLTFWQMLGIDASNVFALSAGTSNHGLMAFLGLISIALPLAPIVWKGPARPWLNIAPLGFLCLLAASFAYSIQSYFSAADQRALRLQSGFFGSDAGGQLAQMAKQAREAANEAMIKGLLDAIGFGVWVVIIASIVLFATAFRRRRGVSAQLVGQPSLSVAR